MCSARVSIQGLLVQAHALEKQALLEEDSGLRSSLLKEAAGLRSEVLQRLRQCVVSQCACASGE